MAEYLQVNSDGSCTIIPTDHYKNGELFIKIDPDGSRSEGPYWEGRRHGNFYITTCSGNIIEATFVDGLLDGRFTISCPNGTYFVGEYYGGYLNSRKQCSKATYDLFSSKFNII